MSPLVLLDRRWHPSPSIRLVDVNWISLVAILAVVGAMVAWPIFQLRTGMIDRRFKPLVWMMIPMVSATGVIIAFAVATAE